MSPGAGSDPDEPRGPAGLEFPVVRTEWTDDLPCLAVVDAVAAATDTPPTELPVLQDSLDVDALTSLVGGDNGPVPTEVRVSFEYAAVSVVVDSEGYVEVWSPTPA